MSEALRPRLARALLAGIAVLLIGWFAVLAHDASLGNAAATRLHERPDMSRADWTDSIDQMRRAEFLNPGTDWTVNRAAYLILRDRGEARRLAEDVVRREPDNLEAWVVIFNATRGQEPRRAAAAAIQMRRLSPASGAAR
jgi:hypothetical protein